MKRFLLTFLFVVALGAATGAGYATGRGYPVLPGWMAEKVATVLPWVPSPVRSAALRADLDGYEFRLVEPEIRQGDGAVVTVRLVEKTTGQAVPDAVIFARRIDMAPEDMPTMTAPLEPLPATEPGTYRFGTDLMMEGGWRLSLAAKVQGQSGTVNNRLVFKAVP